MTGKGKIGLALSGGGYRAAAYHLGTLRKLHQLNILKKVDVISTISGGSIVGAAYCLNKDSYEDFEKSFIADLSKKSVIRSVIFSWYFWRTILFVLLFLGVAIFILFTTLSWLSYIIFGAGIFLLIKYQFKLFPASEAVERAYDKYFYKGATLNALPSRPRLIIGSTNLDTGRPFIFSHDRMGDSSYDFPKIGEKPVYFVSQNFPISRAVTASSCVPFAFTPVHINKKFYRDPLVKTKINPSLVDGGVYDNQGIHKLTTPNGSHVCDYVIISDAGNKLPFANAYNNTLVLLIRTVDLFMNRIKNIQLMNAVYKKSDKHDIKVAYQSLGWDFCATITGFIANLKKNQISQASIEYLDIKPEWILNVDKYIDEIKSHLELAIDYSNIKQSALNAEELKVARSVSTNLKPLTIKQIALLSRHAEIMTEVQIKLYCPQILID